MAMLIVLSLVFPLAVSLLLTPVFRQTAMKMNFMDVPADNHKRHGEAVPLMGGPAMFASWLISVAAGVAFVSMWCLRLVDEGTAMQLLHGLKGNITDVFGIAIGAAGAIVVGLCDDREPMPAHSKFFWQMVISVVAVWFGGVRINVFLSPGGVLSVFASVLWIMLMMNSMNFFDNMDGLAVGTFAISMLSFGVIACLSGQYFVSSFCFMNLGVAVGFWFYNHSPATIFMGDSGSHFIGYLAAVTAAKVTFFNYSASASRCAVLLPLFVLAVPLFDTLAVVVIRTLKGVPFWIGDNNHISHRFERAGLTRPQAVAAVHLLSLVISVGVLPVYWGGLRTAVMLFVQTGLILALVTVVQIWLGVKRSGR